MTEQSLKTAPNIPEHTDSSASGRIRICLLGVSFKTAPVHLREKLAMDSQQIFELLETVRNEDIFEEALILSTCNRTEIYYVAHGHKDGLGHLMEHMAAVKGADAISDASLFYQYHGLDAVRHLFRVAASLDSQIVGEHEILGQLKDAYRIALQARTARFLMHKLMHRAFGVGKRVQSETLLGQGTASVPQAAVELARTVWPSLAGKTVMLIGAGKTAELAAQALLRAGANNLIVANRTPDNARDLARRLLLPMESKAGERKFDCSQCPHYEKLTCPVTRGDRAACSLRRPPQPLKAATSAVGMDDIAGAIGQVDLLISSTAAGTPVLTMENIAPALSARRQEIVMIDIAVPRDIEPALGGLPNVRLFNLDDLDRQVSANLLNRRLEIPRAEKIVDEEAEAFEKWLGALSVLPTIKLLQQRVQETLEAEVDRHARRFSPADREMLEQFARSLSRKILHNPLSYMARLSSGLNVSEDLAVIDLVRKMFKLDETGPSQPPGR